MKGQVNQAVVFTKPVHHLGLPLSPVQLDEELRLFFEGRGMRIVQSKKVMGAELAARGIICQHYLMYSKGSYVESVRELELSGESKKRFEEAFGKAWDAEARAGHIVGNPALMTKMKIDATALFNLWNIRFSGGETQKIQAGLIMAWIEELDHYCINGFYPILEEIFNHPATELHYHVVEFDPKEISWAYFRKKILGATNAAKADPKSFRGRLYSTYGSILKYPGRDNFAHGSAGPLEGLVERIVHEPDFEMQTNPVGHAFLERGIDLRMFKAWKGQQSIVKLGKIFDATEEKDTSEALVLLESVIL